MKSRALTLLSYLQRGSLDEAHQLAVQEAAPHLREVNPIEVVPVPVPKKIYVGVLLAVLTVVVALLPQLPYGKTEGAASSEKERPVVTDGAEMTTLAPLTNVSPDLAARSQQAVTGDACWHIHASDLPRGAHDVVAAYFDAAAPSEAGAAP